MSKCSILFFLSLTLSVSQVGATVIQAGEKTSGLTIRQALDRAKPYDTVLVHQGEYHEGQLLIAKPVVLLGLNYPVLDGDNRSEILSIGASGTVVSGFIIQNGGKSYTDDMAGIKLLSVQNVQIRGNILCNNAFGIYLLNSKKCRVTENELDGNDQWADYSGNGIHLWQCDSILVDHNEIRHHRDGIYFEFVTHSHIENNVSENNYRYGLHFMFSHDDYYTHNLFSDNGAGVAVMFSHGVHMYYNTFRHNWGPSSYGLLLKEISDSEITGNTFEENTTGIYLEGSSRMMVRQCRFNHNGWAMKMMSNCADNQVTENIFNGNSFDVSTNGTLVLSTFKRNYWDKYEGYDLNHDGKGDVPYRPASVFSVITERIPHGILLYRSFISGILDQMENFMPDVLPEKLFDDEPLMKEPLI